MTEDKDRLHVLQVTDCHLLPDPEATLLGVCTHASLGAVLDRALAERTPDALLATGDLADLPGPDTYALFLATVREVYSGPMLCVPGNHDDGADFEAALPTADLTVDGWRLAGVDTHVDGEVGGSVSGDELERLHTVLTEWSSNVLVAGHHCPVDIGCPWLDRHRIDNGDDLIGTLVATHANAYVFGHIHQQRDLAIDGGVPVLGTPSTCFQFARDTPGFALDELKPGYRWLTLAADGSVESQVGRVEDFELNLDLTDRPQLAGRGGKS